MSRLKLQIPNEFQTDRTPGSAELGHFVSAPSCRVAQPRRPAQQAQGPLTPSYYSISAGLAE